MRTVRLPAFPVLLAAPRICDGSGAPLFSGTLLLQNGIIADLFPEGAPVPSGIPRLAGLPEAPGAILSPAFIDAHGHSDLGIFAAPEAAGKTAQGITLEIAGNCGLSPFPLTDRNRAHLQRLWQVYGRTLDWSTFPEYNAALQALDPAMTVLPLVGHNTLHAAAAGYAPRPLNAAERDAAAGMLADALEAGSPGFSCGLLYTPGIYADRAELLTLLRVVARCDKVFAIHLRSEGDRLAEALDETLSLARASGVRKVQLSHLKTAGLQNAAKITAILQALESPDLEVHGDVYPYAAAMTQASVLLPAPWDGMDDERVQKALQNPAEAARTIAGTAREKPPAYWEQVELCTVHPGASLPGERLAATARRIGSSAAALLVAALQEDAPGCRAILHTLSEANLTTLLRHPKIAIGSDETARPLDGRCGLSHPRACGTFPEAFRQLRAAGIPLAEAVRKGTGLPAALFQLTGYGRIAKGAKADLLWWDPARFTAHATYAEPHQPATGILAHVRPETH